MPQQVIAKEKKAMQALKRTFGEILPDQYLEIQNIQNVADNYDKATTALKLYYETKSRELKLNATNESFADELKTDIDDVF